MNSFREFLSLEKGERRIILEKEFTPDQINDIDEAIAIIPNFEAEMKIFVDGFEEVVCYDFVTFKMSLTRKNLDEKKEIGIAHTNSLLDVYEERAVVMVTSEGKIIFTKVVSF